MKKSISIALAITIALCVFSSEGMARTESEEIHGSRVLLDQEQIPLKDPLYMKDGRVFVPLVLITEALDIDVNWHQSTQQVEMKTSFGDRIWFNSNSKIMDLNGKEYVMDVKPFVDDGRIYLPLKHVAETLHMKLFWDSETKTAHLTTVAPYTVEKGDSVESISKEFGLSIAELKRVNGVEDSLSVGQEMKIIAPEFIENPLSAADVDLLARIIFIEAGYESYEGQIAIGNVILNRVEHSSFPNTIKEVIYAPGQFPPAHNGKLEETKPSDSAYNAAREAIGGTEYAKGALYFFNPRVTKQSFFTSKEVITTIGNHRFVR